MKPGDRSRNIAALFVENSQGERFKYPFKHLNGARAMARHVAEGGKPYDDFGRHIVGLSEEMSKLRKFNNYMGRSAVMAESLAGYVDAVKERISTVKKTIESLQKPKFYAETFAAFAKPMMEDVPTDVAENWIDQLTIKQFNEELADVFPYIYNLVSEATKATSLGPEDLEEVAGPKDCWDGYKKDGTQAGTGKNAGKREAKVKEGNDAYEQPAGKYKIQPKDTIYKIAQRFLGPNYMDGDLNKFVDEIMKDNGIDDPTQLQIGQVIQMPHHGGSNKDGGTQGFEKTKDYNFLDMDDEIDSKMAKEMGQFTDEDYHEEAKIPIR